MATAKGSKGGHAKPKVHPSRKKKTASKGSKSVEIFTAPFCPHCQDAKIYLKMKGIRYTEYNLERSKEGEKKFRAYGGKAVPLLIVKGAILRRWDEQAFNTLFYP